MCDRHDVSQTVAAAARRRGRSGPRVALALACALNAGCDTGPEPDAEPIVLSIADLHIAGTSDSIAVVEDLAVLPDGRVWLHNSIEPYFIGFDASGAVLAAHGRRGGGPDEFGAPSGFITGGLDGEAWVLDRGRHLLVRASTPERRAEIELPAALPPGSITTGMSLFANTLRSARLGEEVILPRRTEMGEVSATGFWTMIWNADLVALHPGTGAVRTVLSLPDVMGDMTAHFAATSSGFPPFPFWYRLWAVCGEEIRLYDFVRDELRAFSAAGVELEPTAVPPPFTEVTPHQFARATFDLAAAERAGAVTAGVGEMSAADSAQLLDGMVQRLDGTPEQLAAVLPKFVDFRCAEDGTMWLRPIDLDRGGMRGGSTWLRIADGAIREVRFPERFDPFRFTAGRVWGVARDELDVASLAWIAAPED